MSASPAGLLLGTTGAGVSEPNNIALHDYRLVLMLICKAANTSIKEAFSEVLETPVRLDMVLPNPTKNDAMKLRLQGYRVVTVTRHPLARLASCWRDKIQRTLHAPFVRKYGISDQ